MGTYRNEDKLECESCGFDEIDMDADCFAAGDHCPQCNDGFLEHPIVQDWRKQDEERDKKFEAGA